MKNRTYFIRTLGCQMNVTDSRVYAECLENRGYLPTEDIKEAAIVIVNTCTVRQHAEDRAINFLWELKRVKDKGQNLKYIVLAGCVAERIGEKQIKKMLPFVDLVVGAKDVGKFAGVLDSIVGAGFILPEDSGAINVAPTKTSVFVTITRGCNNFCSYCIVPYVRGPEIHRPSEEIISEIRAFAEKGVKEVTLLGQNVNSYNSEKTTFAGLLNRISEINGLERIRFMTSHPKDLTDDIIDVITSNKKVCEHVHLPLQSGSDRILELMNRKYTMERYNSIIDKLRSKIHGICLTTDVLVGFPHETEDDFNQTFEAIKKIAFDFAYVFKYSPREGTEAHKWGDAIPQDVKEKRHKKILDLCDNVSKQKNSLLKDKTVEVLVDSIDKNRNYFGKTRDNRAVVANPSKPLITPLINVKIIETKTHTLIGEII